MAWQGTCAGPHRVIGRAYLVSSSQNQNRRASLTPGPPPFSAINSIPAASSALRIAFRLANVVGGTPSSDSARLTVATPTLAASARSFALQRTKARAALIWAPVISFISCDCKVISDKLKGHDRLAASAACNDQGPCCYRPLREYGRATCACTQLGSTTAKLLGARIHG